ncbi:MAG: VOC family protein [Deltaproteobacteria bacterium]|nr:VOC family protein [Deltaproteobacteria bacterium]
MPITGINHVTLKVRSLAEARRFYELLGFRISGEREQMLFFSLGDHHHHLALYQMGQDAPDAPSRAVGMAHFSLTVGREEDLGPLHDVLTGAGYQILQVVDHVTNRGFYVRDGDGHVVEITYDAPPEEWKEISNPFAEDHPYQIRGGAPGKPGQK